LDASLSVRRQFGGIHQLRGPMHRAKNAHMGAATAEIGFKLGTDLCVGWF
jgi:hypothetical protein